MHDEKKRNNNEPNLHLLPKVHQHMSEILDNVLKVRHEHHLNLMEESKNVVTLPHGIVDDKETSANIVDQQLTNLRDVNGEVLFATIVVRLDTTPEYAKKSQDLIKSNR